jgi:chemotaxis protein MotB
MDKARPIIIPNKKGAHAGHHGGAWKVAYADFVTAMMALFIVLWLFNSSNQVQEAVGGYFKDPTGTAKKVGSNLQGAGENFVLTRDNTPRLKEQLQKAMKQMADFEKLKSHIDMTVTAEGLRIELSESASGTFFNSGSAKLNSDGAELLITLAQELSGLPNKLSIEGHTDSQPYAPSATYCNWELSADRANAARRIMQSNGIRSDQITQVRGFADQRLRKPDAPLTLPIGASPSSFSTSPRTPTMKVRQRRNRSPIRNRNALGRLNARAKDPRTDSNCIIPF